MYVHVLCLCIDLLLFPGKYVEICRIFLKTKPIASVEDKEAEETFCSVSLDIPQNSKYKPIFLMHF